ncbi:MULTISPECIES: PucR family transcriptional regulator ligand-binding domain-containing protein [Clostridia]|uniref:PucR family transcriptional regulator n=1 Tax=Clostridia TaxID=186801 RepID=UPI000EA1A38C|nr:MULTISPECIES: PucR family transcriptional regulator ligand-binding domain-containing protein [Clostridia]NBJ71066.1 PucR family transcriptional regulator [Roseburia sp. 1XD42-34]RKI75348.1 PucR family transcriptional regulator [Clostridium sp. 1xD42-85]
MFITVKDVLEMEKFKHVELIAGKEGLGRRVENVYFMEVPDIDAYIDANGLLLTTLYPIADNETQINSLIPRLAKQKIAGIAIKPGRYIETIPETMIKQASELDLPLIKLPDNANLSNLTNQILSELLGSRTSVLEFRDRLHQKLLHLLLEGADLSKFVNSIANIVETPVIILDNNLHCIAASIDQSNNALSFSLNDNSAGMSLFKRNFNVQVNNVVYKKNDLFIQPIFAGEDKFGYLVVLLDKGRGATENVIVAVEQASFLVAFLFQTEKALLQKERNYLYGFIRDIFNDHYTSQTEVIEKAKVFKWAFYFPTVILSIKTNITDSRKKLSIYYRMLDSGLIERILAEALDTPIQNCKVVYYNDSLVCFVSIVFEQRLKQKLNHASELIISNFKDLSNIGISISETIYNMKQLKNIYENSLLIFDIYKKSIDQQSFVYFYEDMGLFRLFHYVTDKDVLNAFVKEKLGKVIAYDKRKNGNLLETLKYYIKNNYNIQKTADDMYIHYNTLRYRINKLKELGVEEEDGLEMAQVAVAFQLYLYLSSQMNEL